MPKYRECLVFFNFTSRQSLLIIKLEWYSNRSKVFWLKLYKGRNRETRLNLIFVLIDFLDIIYQYCFSCRFPLLFLLHSFSDYRNRNTYLPSSDFANFFPNKFKIGGTSKQILLEPSEMSRIFFSATVKAVYCNHWLMLSVS